MVRNRCLSFRTSRMVLNISTRNRRENFLSLLLTGGVFLMFRQLARPAAATITQMAASMMKLPGKSLSTTKAGMKVPRMMARYVSPTSRPFACERRVRSTSSGMMPNFEGPKKALCEHMRKIIAYSMVLEKDGLA